ncbi:zinc finger E-box-binding homeobox 1b [Lates japonicus]|uniref:Zinc finger E-box-binding homeobox 1b n=1 Tax=Lates japonicus TaxID=270547 RepID=A0AAD3RLY1_LATJO|nr:zinc finger E-box-binding homeobox 1b [Lates japonicus]
MADGPRCKRRKQANPRRNNVTNYNNVVEAGSDSDDEDKLHIVEEEGSLADGADCDSTLPDDEHPREHCWDRVKEDCVSDGEDDVSTDALVEEMLQQGDTAVIYPEAPEDEPQRQGTLMPKAHDENGTPDSFLSAAHLPVIAPAGYKLPQLSEGAHQLSRKLPPAEITGAHSPPPPATKPGQLAVREAAQPPRALRPQTCHKPCREEGEQWLCQLLSLAQPMRMNPKLNLHKKEITTLSHEHQPSRQTAVAASQPCQTPHIVHNAMPKGSVTK